MATGRDGQPSYSFHGEGTADRSLQLIDLPAALPPEIEALTFASLAEREKGRRVISIDPNLRPTVVGDMESWGRAAERFYRAATLVKASDEDVRIAWGGQITIAEAASYCRLMRSSIWRRTRSSPATGRA